MPHNGIHTMNFVHTSSSRILAIFIIFCLATSVAPAEDVPPSGKSLLSVLYRQNVDKVVYMTGTRVQPEKNAVSDFIKPENGEAEEMTVGSGFIIHPAGYVLTNAHSVMRSVVPVVELRNGSQYEAEVISLWKEQDMAVVKITAKETLEAAEFARPGEVNVGDPLMIIGAPHMLKFTLARGIISGMSRAVVLQDVPGVTLREMLQTDAAINPGTSGGPWFDLRGKVIGMTVSKRGDSDNIGFGISVATLHRLLPGVFAGVVKGRFSLGFTPELEITESEDGEVPRCRVTSVEENSPAAKAGLRVGDVILAADGAKTESPLDFYLNILEKEFGKELCLTVRRESSEAETLTIKFLPRESLPPDVSRMVRERLKMGVSPISEETISEYRLRTPTGVKVMELDAEIYGKLESPPAVGSILVSVNYQRPRSPEHLAQILENIPPRTPMHLVFVDVKTEGEKKINTRTDVRNLRVE